MAMVFNTAAAAGNCVKVAFHMPPKCLFTVPIAPWQKMSQEQDLKAVAAYMNQHLLGHVQLHQGYPQGITHRANIANGARISRSGGIVWGGSATV